MSKKKLITISRNSEDGVAFYFDDSSVLRCKIAAINPNRVCLVCLPSNDEMFKQLGIDNPRKMYRDLGIYTGDGHDICPECKREDLDKVFNYLLKHYSATEVEEAEYEEISDKKEASEWDWLLN